MTERSAPLAPAGTPHCPACDRGGYACELPRDHVGPHRVTFGADDEGPIPDRVWDDRQPTIAPADDPREWRMAGYYISFIHTGNVAIDRILSAIACAANGSHHTDGWNEKAEPRAHLRGESALEWIQNAANDAAKELEALAARTAELEKERRQAVNYIAGRRGMLLHYEDGTPRNMTALITRLEELRATEVRAEFESQLAAAREDSTLIDALADYLERGLGPDHMIRVWAERKADGNRVVELGVYRGPEQQGMPAALRAALARAENAAMLEPAHD